MSSTGRQPEEFFSFLLLGAAGSASAANPKKGSVPTLIFPVAGAMSYIDDFGQPRPGGFTRAMI